MFVENSCFDQWYLRKEATKKHIFPIFSLYILAHLWHSCTGWYKIWNFMGSFLIISPKTMGKKIASSSRQSCNQWQDSSEIHSQRINLFVAPVPFGQWAIKIKPGCFLRPLNDNPHSQVDTIKLIKDWCVSPIPMTICYQICWKISKIS